jgi:hypothetical protein
MLANIMNNVSIIVPNHLLANACFDVLEGVIKQTHPAYQVILVRSGTWEEPIDFWTGWVGRFKMRNTEFIVVRSEVNLMPGAARNLGLQFASGEWVGFLDIETIPRPGWLDGQLTLIKSRCASGAFGATYYSDGGFTASLVRDAIYGRLPLKTVPGSVLRKDIFSKVGQFVPGVRAAEDTEWMIRAKLMGSDIRSESQSCSSLDYYGLSNLRLLGVLKKWRRNYLSSRQLQHLKVQLITVLLVLYVISSFVAFKWNALIAGWQTDSPYYVDHITKLVGVLPLVVYVLFRGFFIPLRKGVPLQDLLPFRFLLLAVLALLLDVVRVSSAIGSMPNGHKVRRSR